jgi:hypothetical protein
MRHQPCDRLTHDFGLEVHALNGHEYLQEFRNSDYINSFDCIDCIGESGSFEPCVAIWTLRRNIASGERAVSSESYVLDLGGGYGN